MQAKLAPLLNLKQKPVKAPPGRLKLLPPSDHEAILAGNLILFVGIIIKIMKGRLLLEIQEGNANILFTISILAYFFLCIDFDSPITALLYLKKWKRLQQFCIRQRSGEAYFHLAIRCSHQNDSIFSQAWELRDSVDTHFAETTFLPSAIEDTDQMIDHQTVPPSPYIFVKFGTDFQFKNESSQLKFTQFCKKFVQQNSKDAKQDFTCKLEIKGFQERASFSYQDANTQIDILFAFLALLSGLAYPWVCWFSKKITCYELSLSKRVAL